MTTQAEAVADRLNGSEGVDAMFSEAAKDAMRLADLYADLTPESFYIPTNDAFCAFRPLPLNQMLGWSPLESAL